ncbi:MAG: cache domain-containing protein [Gammaproteobacteria bacterium]|nr:cache domain-containing protein [Gammaproteobacteria bacterium]
MAKTVEVSVAALTIGLSTLLLLILFWVYARNVKQVSTVVDQKTQLQHVVTTLSHVLSNVDDKVDTMQGEKMNVHVTPALSQMMDAIEKVLVLDDNETHIFLIDRAGNQLADGSHPEWSKDPAGQRPYRNLKDMTVGHEKPILKVLEKAEAGGGFVEFNWPDPQTRRIGKKVAFVQPILGTDWIVGSGIFVSK